MYGYDSPELKPPLTMINRKSEIKKAIEAKQYLSSLILNKIVTIYTTKRDKYGRILATVYINKGCSIININQMMVEEKYGKPYYGGHK
jgi:endonuclease YncB( thermonuclease family)